MQKVCWYSKFYPYGASCGRHVKFREHMGLQNGTSMDFWTAWDRLIFIDKGREEVENEFITYTCKCVWWGAWLKRSPRRHLGFHVSQKRKRNYLKEEYDRTKIELACHGSLAALPSSTRLDKASNDQPSQQLDPPSVTVSKRQLHNILCLSFIQNPTQGFALESELRKGPR